MKTWGQRLLYLSLALAWVSAPLIHAASHILQAEQRPMATAFAAMAERGCTAPGVRLHAPHKPHHDACENCQSLAQAKGLAPVVPALAALKPVLAPAEALAQAVPRSTSFLLFDHRGPPLQA
jgi:hypothetical protein